MNKPIWCKTPREILDTPSTAFGRQVANVGGFFALVLVLATVIDLALQFFGVKP